MIARLRGYWIIFCWGRIGAADRQAQRWYGRLARAEKRWHRFSEKRLAETTEGNGHG